jgi:uncharacterized membrane protein
LLSVPFGLSILFGVVALGMLLLARRELRRSKERRQAINLVRFGFVLAVVGMLIVSFIVVAFAMADFL